MLPMRRAMGGSHDTLMKGRFYIMPWCPNCKNEYREGISVCADCGVPLAEELSEAAYTVLTTLEASPEATDTAQRLADFLEYEGIRDATLVEVEGGHTEVRIPEGQQKEARKALHAFLAVEQEKKLAGLSEEERQSLAEAAKAKAEEARCSRAYVSAGEKYQENRSTAFTFIGFSILGLVFVGLNAVGIIGFLGNWFSIGVAATLFVVFLAIGVSSYHRASSYRTQIDAEEQERREVTEWMEANFTWEFLENADISSTDDGFPAAHDGEASMSDEEKDIVRFDYMKAALSRQFPDLPEDFAEHLIDEFYARFTE